MVTPTTVSSVNFFVFLGLRQYRGDRQRRGGAANGHRAAGQDAFDDGALQPFRQHVAEGQRRQQRADDDQQRRHADRDDLGEGDARAQQGDAGAQQDLAAKLDAGLAGRIGGQEVEGQAEEQGVQQLRAAVAGVDERGRQRDGDGDGNAGPVASRGAGTPGGDGGRDIGNVHIGGARGDGGGGFHHSCRSSEKLLKNDTIHLVFLIIHHENGL